MDHKNDHVIVGLILHYADVGRSGLRYPYRDKYTDANISGVIIYDGAAAAEKYGLNVVRGTPYKVGCTWSTGKLSVTYSGQTPDSVASYDGSVAGATLYIGSDAGAESFLYGNIKNLKIWGTAMSDAELQTVITF